VIVTLIVVAAASSACARRSEPARAAIRAALETQPRADAGDRALQKDVRRFYAQADYWPAWFRGTSPGRQWDRLLAALPRTEAHGLDPEAYDLARLRERRAQSKKTGLLRHESFAPPDVAEIDIALTRAFLRCAAHLAGGELTPEVVDDQWRGRAPATDPVAMLEQALRSGDVEGTLIGAAPKHEGYTRLVDAMSTAPAARREQIALNLDRWRWLPTDLGSRYILVNVPQYELALVEDGRPTLRMRVVVGKPFDPTPVFSDEMKYITFNPSWNVPEEILTEELLPALKDDEQYLEDHDMEIVKDQKVVSRDDVDLDDPKSFTLRQRPGTRNPLGQVKFIFPNQFDVYLHGTPSTAAFAASDRALSHGCIRLEKPIELAVRLLGDQPKWDRAAIEKAIADGDEKSVKLSAPLPVHIVYWTAWVDADGHLQFADDVYGDDRTQAGLLASRHGRLDRRAAN
jgi:murein L,D-transpeptidase YcbB/YkuD